MLLDKSTDQIVRRVVSRYLVKTDPPLTDHLVWPDFIGLEESCYMLAEVNYEFGTKLFPAQLTSADLEEINTVEKLIAHIERRIRA
jgi:hypothetical protein